MQSNNYNIDTPLEDMTIPFADVSTKKIIDKINVVSKFTKEEIDHFLSLGILENKANPGFTTQTQIDCFFKTLENYSEKTGEIKFSQCYDFSKDPDVLSMIEKTGSDEILSAISQNLVHAAY